MRVRPSELYNVDDAVAAYCFDRAVHHFGSSLKAELDSVEGKTDKEIQRKQTGVLERWIPELGSTSSQRFRDPAKEL